MDVVRRPATEAGRTLPAELRRKAMNCADPLASGHAIEDGMLRDLYDSQYRLSVKEADPSRWPYQIKFSHQLAAAIKTSSGQIALSLKCLNNDEGDYSGLFDLVIAATGYDRSGHERIMRQLSDLVDGHNLSVNRDYQVNSRKGLLAEDCGLWLQGSLGEADDVCSPSTQSCHC
jgi:L-ornithine N5-oxygenase